MPSQPREPTARQVRLGHVLQGLRIEGGHGSQESVATALGWSESKLSRIESAKIGIAETDLVRLLDHYGVTNGELRDYITHLKRKGNQQGWESVVRRTVSAVYADFIGYESDAVEAHSLQPVLIPGLLQTHDYAAAVLDQHMPDLTAEDRQERLEVRARRQEVFTRPEPLVFWGVISESALRHVIGSPAVMAAQLEHLLTMCEQHSHIHLQVLPESAAIHAALFGPFVILSFRERWEPAICYVEGFTSNKFVEDATQVRDYEQLFKRLMMASLRGSESIELIRKYRNTYSKG
jgi:hypothetical protein